MPEEKYTLVAIPPTYPASQFVINNITYSIETQLSQGTAPQQTPKPSKKPQCRPIKLSVTLYSANAKIPKGLKLKSFSVTSADSEWSAPFAENTTIKTDNKISNTAESCEELPENLSETRVKVEIADLAGNSYYAQNKLD